MELDAHQMRAIDKAISEARNQAVYELNLLQSAVSNALAALRSEGSPQDAKSACGTLTNAATTLTMAQRYAGELAGMLQLEEIIER